MKNANKGRLGFTLIELLVVVLIIGILAAVALPQYKKVVEKSRITGALSTLSTLQKALDVWVLQNGFPTTSMGDSNANSVIEQLDVGIGNSTSQGEYGPNIYKVNDFYYRSWCNPTSCTISAWKGFGYNAPISYGFTYTKSSDGTWSKTYNQYKKSNGEYCYAGLGSYFEDMGFTVETRSAIYDVCP